MNRAELIGNLGRDPEIRTTQAGEKVATLSVATSERWTDKASNERKEITHWHTVVIWNQALVKVVENYCRKGSKIFVAGKMQTRKWQDRDGNDRWTTEVVLGTFGGELELLGDAGGNRPPPPADERGGGGTAKKAAAKTNPADLDDEVPF